MLGLGKKDPNADKLTVQVHAVAGSEAYGLALKLWDENIRTVKVSQQSGKEFMRFGYANPKCVAWLQRDAGRKDLFELIVRWEHAGTHEVHVIENGGTAANGDDSRTKAILNSMLITPSVVLR